jgi:hypothetical protein
VRARGSARRGRPCRAVAGLGLEPESGSRSGTTPTGRPRLSAREKGRREKGRAGGVTGPGEKAIRLGQLGRVGRKGGKEERPARLGPRGRKKREGKEEERVGRA